ncbi:MAG: RsmB/NOP family class I SAM-dependent RNA methyltransferase [Candidatus Helarchaeota archaeon]
MNQQNQLIQLLTAFLSKKRQSTRLATAVDSKTFHYYKEIVRNWNTLNFIVQKVKRLIPNHLIRNHNGSVQYPLFEAIFFYVTYRVIWESASLSALSQELRPFMKILRPFENKLRTFDLKRYLVQMSPIERLSIEEAMPSFFIRQVSFVMNADFLKHNLQFMNNLKLHRYYTVRFNSLLLPPTGSSPWNRLLSDLKEQKILLRQDPHIKELYHVPQRKKAALLQTKWYKRGYMINQDKASAAVVHVLNPKPHERICELSAAPGLKTSFMAQLMQNTGEIIAFDLHKGRVRQMRAHLNAFHVINTTLITVDSCRPPLNDSNQFDRILLDAPCTGSGAFFNNPELKWRQTPSFLRQMVKLQRKLLRVALRLLKPGGVLVYATCSLYPEEGELQILPLFKEIASLQLPQWFSPSYLLKKTPIPGCGRLFPAKHHSQGFFITKFKKKNKI